MENFHQNEDDFNYDDILKEIETKNWSEDIMTLSNKQIHDLLKNMMWQLFLVQTYNIDINIKNTVNNLPLVSIIINGHAYRDGANLSYDEISQFEQDEFDEDDFEDEVD